MAKRIQGQRFLIEIDLFGDGHDVVNGHLLYRHSTQRKWTSVQLLHIVNDRWKAEFRLTELGTYEYKVSAWVDHALNWQHELQRKVEGGQHVDVELLDGIQYLDHLLGQLKGKAAKAIGEWKTMFADPQQYGAALKAALSEELHAHFLAYPQQRFALETPVRKVWVDRKKAEFSAWYELFPRSASRIPGKHGTFKEVEALLPRIEELGFDVLYFPPIHPIGRSFRKGKKQQLECRPRRSGLTLGRGCHRRRPYRYSARLG
jgi:starch synthase (maltosyl-transferring)